MERRLKMCSSATNGGQISGVVQTLSQTYVELSNDIEELEKRLQAAVTPANPPPIAASGELNNITVPLAQELDGINSNFGALIYKVQELMKRIEL
jgi:outer membrane murein-binding lipoprotein Lpp